MYDGAVFKLCSIDSKLKLCGVDAEQFDVHYKLPMLCIVLWSDTEMIVAVVSSYYRCIKHKINILVLLYCKYFIIHESKKLYCVCECVLYYVNVCVT